MGWYSYADRILLCFSLENKENKKVIQYASLSTTVFITYQMTLWVNIKLGPRKILCKFNYITFHNINIRYTCYLKSVRQRYTFSAPFCCGGIPHDYPSTENEGYIDPYTIHHSTKLLIIKGRQTLKRCDALPARTDSYHSSRLPRWTRGGKCECWAWGPGFDSQVGQKVISSLCPAAEQ